MIGGEAAARGEVGEKFHGLTCGEAGIEREVQEPSADEFCVRVLAGQPPSFEPFGVPGNVAI
jgi:hypothetical protein